MKGQSQQRIWNTATKLYHIFSDTQNSTTVKILANAKK